MFFSLTFISGQLIDTQIGFGVATVYDPQSNAQVPVTGNLLNIALLLVFFAADGHQKLLQIMYLTLEKLPVGGIKISRELGIVALELFSKSFMLGVMVAMPIIASSLVLEFCFGLLQRTVPQLNMFVVGMPVKIIIGFVIFMATLPVFTNFSARILSEMFSGVEQIFATFSA
jgi:flagellar biosynthetic protein FliR